MANTKEFFLKGSLATGSKYKFSDVLEFIVDAEDIDKLILNFEEVSSVDSSHMGALLFIQDKAVAKNITLVIRKPQGDVDKLFKLSKIDTLIETTYE